MDAIQQLIEVEAIRRLKARYWRCMDTKDYDGFAAVFTEDATLLFDSDVSTLGRDGKTNPIVRTRQGIRDYVSNSQRYATTVHQGHTPEIDILSETEARGIWTMEDIVERPDTTMHGHGHYHETYRKVNGEWLIATVHLTRLRVVNTYKRTIHAEDVP
jgi:uncharacterized protein (TIGR02246 family)